MIFEDLKLGGVYMCLASPKQPLIVPNAPSFTDPPALSALGFHLQNTNKHQQGASSVEYAHHVACDGNPVLVRLKGTAYILPSLPLPLAYI